MGTHRADVYEQLKFTLYQDHADTGESAGIAMGLVMLGSKSPEAIEDMVGYAQETQHEKIQRGLAIGIALVMYGRLEEADTLIDTLCRDKDANLRRSGMYTIAMAYCGTASNTAIQRLLHMAASDVDHDVRRTAVMALGFLLFKKPEQCPELVNLIFESYIPRVRYGAAMALGIACAGTGSREAIAIIEQMTNDTVNYVRRAALIASAMIMIQHTEVTCPKVKEFRAMYAKIIADKHEDVMVKLGAIFAQGIIDAGGRNVTVSLASKTGHTNMMAVVGMLIFNQYWYWFPLAHFLSLAFTPSCLIGLNENLDMPVMGFKSNAKPSTYGYPPPLEEKKKEDKEKVATAVLSITAKQKKKEAEKRKDASGKDKEAVEKMEVDEKKDELAAKKEAAEKKAAEDLKKEEPNFEILQNPCRVVKPQLNLVNIEEGGKFKSIKDLSIGGIVMVKRIDGGEDNEPIVEPVTVKKALVESEDEPEPPEPFEYTE
jgi:26S proteasome regulatory subunit N2